MSTSQRFLSFLRAGAASAIGTTVEGPHASLTVQTTVTVNDVDQEPVANITLPLAGPGEVVGLAAGAIRRRWPRPGADDAESNLLAQVELADPDLPWRFSPEAPVGDKLRPWLTLLVLRISSADAPNTPSEIEYQTSPGRQGGLPTITLRKDTPLPDLRTAWAWAHTQWSTSSTSTPIDTKALRADLLNRPQAVCARILCPRQLKPRSTWLAALVPTYQRGVLRGLGGRSLEALKHTSATALAWTTTIVGEPLRLPVYASWTFSTAEAGDFQSLVEALVPRRASDLSGVGSFEVRLDYPTRSGGLAQRVAMPGALSVLGQDLPLRIPGRGELMDAIGAEIRPTAPTEDPVVKPPIYGARHILREQLTEEGAPLWFTQLNADPRWRAAAGLGAEIVRRDQRELLDEAWNQYEVNLRDENERRQRASWGATLREHALERVLPDSAVSGDDPRSRLLRERAAALLGRASPTTARGIEPQLRRVRRGSAKLARGLQLGSINSTRGTIAARVGQPDAVANPSLMPDVSLYGAVSFEQPSGAMPMAFASPGLDPGALPDLSDVIDTVDLPDIDELRDVLRDKLKNAINTANTQHQIRLQALRRALLVKPAPPPLVAEPEFTDPPLSERLERLSKNWILPGLDSVPQDSVLLLEENRPFIEALALGATVEMSRELLYHEFPTDERGSLFRRFWRSADPDTRDMARHHEWTKSLGGHGSGGTAKRLVLLIRGRLLLRYSEPLVSLVKINVQGSGESLEVEVTHTLDPDFSDFIDPDMGYYGFALTETELRDDNDWFLCIQEPPTAPRFGTEAATEADPGLITWDDFTNAASAAAALSQPPARVFIRCSLLLPAASTHT